MCACTVLMCTPTERFCWRFYSHYSIYKGELAADSRFLLSFLSFPLQYYSNDNNDNVITPF